MVNIRTSLTPDAWPEMRDFLAQHYRPDLAMLWRPLFEWQYQSARRDGHASMLTAWDGPRLVATLGYVPAPMWWGNWREPIVGAWAMNWMVDPEYRTGIGWLLLRQLQDMHPVVFSVDASADNLNLVQPLGWTVEPSLPRYVRVLDVARAHASFGFSADVATAPFAPAPSAVRDQRLFGASRDGYEPTWSLYAPMAYGTIRSSEHLRWRYVEHPRFTYTVVTTGDHHRPAVCVFRIELAFDREGRSVAPVGRLLEFFHPTDARGQADAERLLAAVLTRLAEEGCVYADITTSSAAYGDTLEALEWLRDSPGAFMLPSRLTPIEHVPRLLNVEFGVRPPYTAPALQNAYITTGDCDADRPALLAERMPVGTAAAQGC